MADRICPRCTCAIIIPCVDKDHRWTGWWQCTRPECALEWQERGPGVATAAIETSVAALADLDPMYVEPHGGLSYDW